MNYDSSLNVPIWQPGVNLVREHLGLIRSLVLRDLSNRYQGSVMGWAWSVITPAVQIVIFTFIFAVLFNAKFGAERSRIGYAIYLFCGMLPWIAISEAIQRSATTVVENVNLVKRVVFPIEALPVNLACSGIVIQLVGTVILLVLALVFEGTLHVTTLWLPVLLLPQFLLTIGLSWLIASLGVFVRDVAQFMQLFLMAWQYLTPIIYPESAIPPQFRWLLNFNPIAPLIRSYRNILLQGIAPDWSGMGVTMAFSVGCFLVGYWWFIRTKKAFPDVL